MMLFISILAIFIIAYGVITHAVLYPGHAFDFELFRNVLNKGFWSIFGDFRILNELITDPGCYVRNDCQNYPHNSGTYFTLFTLMAYCVVANVLLINLLIAMFR